MVGDPGIEAGEASQPSRRAFLRLAAGGLGALLLACGPTSIPPVPTATPREAALAVTPTPPSPTPTPRPVPPAGHASRTLLPGTPWETALSITHSGVRGPSVLVLGGVHGNEPGGWLAAEQVTGWTPLTGSLLVVPRANVLAIRALERTFPELGDLNRLYPGNPDGLPMARMAAAIVDASREFNVELVLDMHESWGFYAERVQNGTAFLGQTITAGQGPEFDTVAQGLAARANELVGGGRDRLLTRDQALLPGATPTPTPPQGSVLGRSTSSLGIGRYVDGVTPILVEMGQQNQSLERRIELHLIVGRALLQSRGML